MIGLFLCPLPGHHRKPSWRGYNLRPVQISGKPLQRELLTLLSDGGFHSGVDLAAAIGVSRTAVWKQITGLEQLGVDVHKVRGRGYRIPGGMELLAAKEISRGLEPAALERFGEPHILMDVDSTNRVAMDAVTQGQRRYVCFAERQTAGRGRRGRDWVSPFGCNLYCSLIQRFRNGFAGMEGLSLAVGIGVRRAVRQNGAQNVGLKWPNDVVVDDRKLGGILIEVTGDVAGDCFAVIGIGLNLRMPERAGERIDQDWANLDQCSTTSWSRNSLAIDLLNQLSEVLGSFQASGLAPFLADWEQADTLNGCRVQVSGLENVTGVCRGVDDKGGLVVETNSGVRVFYGGEVSLRAEQ